MRIISFHHVPKHALDILQSQRYHSNTLQYRPPQVPLDRFPGVFLLDHPILHRRKILSRTWLHNGTNSTAHRHFCADRGEENGVFRRVRVLDAALQDSDVRVSDFDKDNETSSQAVVLDVPYRLSEGLIYGKAGRGKPNIGRQKSTCGRATHTS